MDLDELLLRIQEKKVNFIVFEAMHNHNGNSQCYCVDIVKYAVEKAQKLNILEMEEFPAQLKQGLLRKKDLGHQMKFVILYLI